MLLTSVISMALTAAEKKKTYRLHNLNKKSLENAIDLIKLNIKNSFREEVSAGNYTIKQPFTDKQRVKLLENIRSYNRILFGLLVSWSDESIRRLFFEPSVFTEPQIDFLLGNRPLEQKWTFALKIAFLKANGLIPAGNERCVGININSRNFRTLNPGLLAKYDEIQELITDFLIPSFNIRNKVQHGEWIAAFRPPDSKIYSPELTKSVFKENIVTISARIVIFNSVYQMIVDLATFSSNNFKLDPSTTPFEYFYSRYIKKINYEKSKILSPNLNNFVKELIDKKEKGKNYRQLSA
ncbi:MAG: hypothetical protein C0490_04195 [Marivirga sp.]|nr:hypothetical protein [Marivirga sp.]